jgi:hypothetical protein
MNVLKTQMQELIKKGLYGVTLEALLPLARQSFERSPALYGTMIYVFASLQDIEEEYSGQGMPADRYEHIVAQLTQPLLGALDAESDSPAELLGKLNILHSAFFSL